jgi:hypothetical protein
VPPVSSPVTQTDQFGRDSLTLAMNTAITAPSALWTTAIRLAAAARSPDPRGTCRPADAASVSWQRQHDQGTCGPRWRRLPGAAEPLGLPRLVPGGRLASVVVEKVVAEGRFELPTKGL